MSWKQRLSNSAYREQLTEQHGDPFYDRVIGVYTKLPESKIEGIGVWLGELDELKGQLFSLYIDLLYVELLVDAVANLSVHEVIENSASAERELVATLIEDVFYAPVWASLLKRHSCSTLKDLARLVNRGRRELEHAAEMHSKFEDAQERFRPPQFGEFGKCVATSLGHYCNGQSAVDTEAAQNSWVFRVCMDEGENLSHDQQLVVNSMYRLSRWPLFFAIAYVEMPDVRSTFKRNLTLTDADRKTIALTTQTDSEFREYVEGVVNIRAKSEFGEEATKFSVESLLGKMSLNRILDTNGTAALQRRVATVLVMTAQSGFLHSIGKLPVVF
ncbi:hypothetical protein LOC72_21370 [Roseiconus lacunae]|uniref:ORC-CDC6 family AAA ATPase n=1 Tax=Roseiconus lacunae TaxID=2605694 RepID=UPI001E43F9BF|nr:hypothetical protein [Roseiconus lacunae]MCD0462033.1 hypothetical protein [Roseiconus lacunae]